MAIRVYDIAKKLGIESKEVLAKARELGIAAARVPSSSLDCITAQYLEEQLGGKKVAGPPGSAVGVKASAADKPPKSPSEQTRVRDKVAFIELPPRGIRSAQPAPPRQTQIALSGSAPSITIKVPIIVRELANKLNVQPFRIIADLMEFNVFANVQQAIDEQSVRKVCAKYGFDFQAENVESAADSNQLVEKAESDVGNKAPPEPALRISAKLMKLKQYIGAGTEIVFVLAGGGELTGRIVRFEEGVVVIEQGGRERILFEESISGFGVADVSVQPPVPRPPPSPNPAKPSDKVEYLPLSQKPGVGEKLGSVRLPQRPAQGDAQTERSGNESAPTHEELGMLTGLTALEYLDAVRKALKASPASVNDARQAARALTTAYISSPLAIQRDSNIRYALISVFKAVEYERKMRLAQNESSREFLDLGQTLHEINAALRTPKGIRADEHFSDLYHFLVAVRPHRAHFEANAAVWKELGDSLKAAHRIGTEVMNDLTTVARWEREPHRKQTHLYRLSEVCRYLVSFGFVAPDETSKLQQQAEGYLVMAGRKIANVAPTAIAMGRIVSFGTQGFGFIQARDARTLFFHVDEVVSPGLRAALERSLWDANGVFETDVDFDEEPRPAQRYDAARNVRPAGHVRGFVQAVMSDRNFGYIDLPDGKTAHFVLSSAETNGSRLAVGMHVLCRLVQEERGWSARDVCVIQAEEIGVQEHEGALIWNGDSQRPNAEAQRILGAAQIARERGDTREASALYEQGIRECPVLQMFLSYAAMTKEFDPERAMTIYELGIKEFSDKYKIFEDAGVHAGQLGDYPRAVQLLERALELSRQHPLHTGEKGSLVALARTHYKIGTEDSLRKASHLYDEVIKLFGGTDAFRARVPKHIIDQADAIQATLARLRSQNQRGNLAYGFIEGVGFKVVDAQFSEKQDFADLVCQITDKTLIGDFALGPRVFVRCMLTELPANTDFHTLEKAVAESALDDGCDPSAALLVVSSVSKGLENNLWARIRPRPNSENKPLVIIPLPQRDLERLANPVLTLRQALSTWLYRRDLFSIYGSVSGAGFFGRKNILAEIHDALLLSQPLGIFGLRKIGKTSVLLAVSSRQNEEKNIVLHVDLLSEKGRTDLFPSVFCGLAEDLRMQASAHLPPSFSWDLAGRFTSTFDVGAFPVFDGFLSDLTRVLRSFRAHPAESRPRVVIMLDEIEELLTASARQAFDFFGALRGLHQRFRDIFNIVVTAANPSISERAHFGGADNPVFNFFRGIYLPFLDFSECKEMITELGRGMGIKFSARGAQEVFTATGGHPFVARQLCSIAAKSQTLRPIELQENDIRTAEYAYLKEHGDRDLQEIIERLSRDYPRENALLRELAFQRRDQRRGISTKEFRHLRDYQLVTEGPQGIAFRMSLMEKWLRGDHRQQHPPRSVPVASRDTHRRHYRNR